MTYAMTALGIDKSSCDEKPKLMNSAVDAVQKPKHKAQLNKLLNQVLTNHADIKLRLNAAGVAMAAINKIWSLLK
jgi:hypothetical protein